MRNTANQTPLKNAFFVISIVYVNLLIVSVKLITWHFPDSHDSYSYHKVQYNFIILCNQSKKTQTNKKCTQKSIRYLIHHYTLNFILAKNLSAMVASAFSGYSPILTGVHGSYYTAEQNQTECHHCFPIFIFTMLTDKCLWQFSLEQSPSII